VESLYLLIPLSALLVLAILAVFGWALHRGQFEDLDREGERILTDEAGPLDGGQEETPAASQQFPGPSESTQRAK
jgi:cbb3-type cytochrome oxidase maturation protein